MGQTAAALLEYHAEIDRLAAFRAVKALALNHVTRSFNGFFANQLARPDSIYT
jgi:hypothetical protein